MACCLRSGTLAYQCPEAVGAYTYDACSGDVWMLGCTLYELLTGRVLFQVSKQGVWPCAKQGWVALINTQLPPCVWVGGWPCA